MGSWIAIRFITYLASRLMVSQPQALSSRLCEKTAAPRFWQMDRFELDCTDDPIRISLKEITSQPNE